MKNVLLFSLLAVAIALLPLIASADSAWTYQPAKNRIGRIYFYERSNSDGSMPERISVFRRDETRVEVYKESGRCENAALVTADMDWTNFSAVKITGGQLTPDAQTREFAFLTWSKPERVLRVLVKLPDMEIRNDAPIPAAPWHLYDFDFASLTLATPHLTNPRDGFNFGMALLWADPSARDPLTWMGDVKASYAGEDMQSGIATHRYSLSGSALAGERSLGSAGNLWLHAVEGHLVAAVLPAPNHPGYRDMMIRLVRISDGGASEWRDLLLSHFRGC